jgi:hypothetical protein
MLREYALILTQMQEETPTAFSELAPTLLEWRVRYKREKAAYNYSLLEIVIELLSEQSQLLALSSSGSTSCVSPDPPSPARGEDLLSPDELESYNYTRALPLEAAAHLSLSAREYDTRIRANCWPLPSSEDRLQQLRVTIRAHVESPGTARFVDGNKSKPFVLERAKSCVHRREDAYLHAECFDRSCVDLNELCDLCGCPWKKHTPRKDPCDLTQDQVINNESKIQCAVAQDGSVLRCYHCGLLVSKHRKHKKAMNGRHRKKYASRRPPKDDDDTDEDNNEKREENHGKEETSTSSHSPPQLSSSPSSPTNDPKTSGNSNQPVSCLQDSSLLSISSSSALGEGEATVVLPETSHFLSDLANYAFEDDEDELLWRVNSLSIHEREVNGRPQPQ